MTGKIAKEKANIIVAMEQHLETELLKAKPEKLWSESFIRRQIDKRARGDTFTLEDHIRAMVYSMLSSGATWDRVAKDTDSETKCISSVDEVFFNYDTEQLFKHTPAQLRDNIKEIHCATQSTLKQMKALVTVNIPKLLSIEKEYGTIDAYYQKFMEMDDTLKTLIILLSTTGSIYKLEQMNIALVCEYLRNVGYDIPKPDRHICRILGSEYLAFSDRKKVPPFDAFDLVVELAEKTGRCVAETDYILWSYCADGYGEICTKKAPKCGECAVREYCKKAENGRD
jgi:hypothetical protein